MSYDFFATEQVPQPVVVLGVVDRDLPARALSVRPSERASGCERLNWRTAHLALVQAEQTGWRTGSRFGLQRLARFRLLTWLRGRISRWWLISLRASRLFSS
jgi:hypothetical protein